MGMRYFRILDSLDRVPGRWHLGEPIDERGREVDARDFTQGQRVSTRSILTIPQLELGVPLGFTFAAFDMPVVRRDVADLLSRLADADIQRIPVRIEGQGDEYEIVNSTTVVKCLDEEKSYVMRWTKEDGRPDKIGQYRMVDNMHIRNKNIGKSKLFRIYGWEIALICAQNVKSALKEHGITGIAFREV